MAVFSVGGLVQTWVVLTISYPAYTQNINPKLVVPSDPVVISTGHDVVLPCHLSPEKSAVPMEIRWFRDKYLEFVFLYQAGKEENGKGYKGRVSLFPQELPRGNVSLLLRDVRLSDGGEYKCHVSFSSWYEEPIVQLTVRQSGSRPMIEVLKHNRDSIQMSCSSEDWYPEPYMFWTDIRGRKMEAKTKRAKQSGGGGVFSITSYISVNKSDTEGVSCVAGEQNHKVQFESLVKLSDEFFMSTMPDRLYISAVIIPLVVGLLCVIVAVLMVNNQKKVRQEKLKDFDNVTDQLKRLREEHSTQKRINEAVKCIPDSVWNYITECADDVTLDPDTAHPKLRVEADGKCASAVNKNLPVEPNRRRFEDYLCVLAKEGFSSGRHYWQVEVGDKTAWYIGVGKEEKDTKEVFTPEEGYWTLYYSSPDKFCAPTVPETQLPLDLKPQTVGVFVDYERGHVSFYNVDERCHIYTFTGSLKEKLFPFFGTRLTCKNPLIISTVEKIKTPGLSVVCME